jgi:UDP-2,4-diacetamido-2,4,6-trideoxy-beta-L-altropyranose hydrolase
MKVCILTEGGAGIGIGHITRCLSLYQAFEEKGIQPLFVVNGDETVKQYLKDTRHELINWSKKDSNALLKNTDIVIIDSYLAGFEFYEEVSKSAKVPVYLDDNKRIDYPKGIVVNGTIFADELGYPSKKNITYLLGSKYIPLRKDFWDLPEKETNQNIQSALITFGGDDTRNLTPEILKLLNRDFPEYIKKVIIGGSYKNIAQIESLRNAETELVYSPDAEGMKQAMLEADIAISAAGQTLYELARVGVPTMAIAVADNQMNNVKGWQKTGFIEYAGWWEEQDILEKTVNSLRLLQDVNIRRHRSIIGKTHIDGQGARRIVEDILKY